MSVFVTGGSGFIGGALITRLVADGQEVRALARSHRTAQIVTARGARPVAGSLADVDALAAGMCGATAVVHAAARLTGGPREREDMYATNVTGTQAVLTAAMRAGVPTLVHLSTEQVIMGPRPLIGADETWPYPQRHSSWYGATKADAEACVLAAPAHDIRAVAVRPRFVWGTGDTTLLPQLMQAARDKTFLWIDGGNYFTSTCHVNNVVEGTLCALRKGEAGQSYFLSDGQPQHFRTFVSALLASQDMSAPTASVPRWAAAAAAIAVEITWNATRRRGPAPIDPATLAVIGQECTVDDTKARTHIGYRPTITVDHGLQLLRKP